MKTTPCASHRAGQLPGLLNIHCLLAVLILIVAPPSLRSVAAQQAAYAYTFEAGSGTTGWDRWMYPFNVSPGTRIQAPLFGAMGSTMFDERDGQLLLAVDTASLGIPSGLDPVRYDIRTARITLTEAAGGYLFDSTQDSFLTYLSPDQDLDDGRPIELFGAALRSGYERFGFGEAASEADPEAFYSFSSFGPPRRSSRPVYPIDTLHRDVSNHLDSLGQGTAGFDPRPLAVAEVFVDDEPLAAGDLVPAEAQLRFELDLSLADVRRSLQQGLSAGQLGWIVSSLHATGELGQGPPVPQLVTADHLQLPVPLLELELAVRDEWYPGDFDWDHDVDSEDLLTIIGNWTGADAIVPARGPEQGDLDWDLDVDSVDLQLFLGQWTGAQAGLDGATAQTVPEPSNCVLILCGLFGCLFFSRRPAYRACRFPARP